VLMAEDLPPAPEGKTYEAWLMRGGNPKPAGLFGPHGEETATLPIEGSLQGADKVAVTVEPSGGSSEPTSDPLLTATL
jgi:anti-sigma-K factor RskA